MSSKGIASPTSEQDLSYFDTTLSIEELNIDGFGTDLPTQLMYSYENHPQSNNKEEVLIDDIQWRTYLNDIDYNLNSDLLQLDEMPLLEEAEDVFKEENKTQLNVPVEAKFSRTEETFLLEETVPEKLVENAGVEYQNSDVPYLNVESNGNENSNIQQVTDPCDRKISTSHKMNEMNNTSTKRKRKKSKLERGGKSIPLCNCKKSKCLQLYCECFSAGVFCNKDCGCTDCINQEIYEDMVEVVKQRIQSKNPLAFAPKNVGEKGATSSGLKKGCKCKQSMCRKKYCECFQAGFSCTIECGCGSCHNPFGIREGSNNIGQENITDGTTNLQGLSSVSEYMQLPANNLSSTFLNNLPSLDNHTPETPTSNLLNGNGYLEASNLAPDMTSMHELLYQNFGIANLLQQMMIENEMVHCDQQSNFAPQPCVSMPSNQPPRYNNLLYQPSTSTWTSYIPEGSSSNPMSNLRDNNHLREGILNSNSMLDLRGNQQGITQIMPNFTSVIPYRNSNGSSSQNGGDHRNVTRFS